MSIPTATYRIQFNPAFGFTEARRIVSYLKDLGVSDLYASPVFKARKGSSHGYDVIDPVSLNPELGSYEEFAVLLKDIRDSHMGWVQDIVPNHMAFDGQNTWLMDVLEKGKKSAYWGYFDIEWKDTYQSLKGKVLAPFLGQFYSKCLENSELQLRFIEGNLTVNYYDLRFPLKIETYRDVFLYDLNRLERVIGKKSQLRVEYLKAVENFGAYKDKKRNIEQIKNKLWVLCKNEVNIGNFINENIRIFNGKKGVAKSFDPLDQLLCKQNFRLTFWKFGAEEINYRRFFNINQLISMKVEDPKVFEQTHRLILDLVRKKEISGLRIDHIDGLYDPKKYLQRLRKSMNMKYIVVEKILEHNERIPVSWPVEGTTGYDFLNCVNGLFVDGKNVRMFDDYYRDIAKNNIPFAELVSSKKRLIVGKHMAGDVDNLAQHMKKISRKDRYGRDITLYGLKRALVEVLALFPRYRTYADKDGLQNEDRSVIRETNAKAKELNPGLVYELDFITDILLLNFKDYLSVKERKHWIHFVRRFQQFTGPLMAKGFEDTTLYIYNRLISLNEVGGNPDRFGVSVKEFHRFNQTRNAHWPCAMSASATHDTKRGEDARARINVLSEIPDQWIKKVNSWRRLNRAKKIVVGGRPAPDDNDEYFLYQTLLGGFPFSEKELKTFKERLSNYIIKAVREAKVHTAWIQPDESYEKAYLSFIDGILNPLKGTEFLNDFSKFQKLISFYGVFNSLSQTLIKLTAPGVPDFYQGCELWDFSFVDPDNRRPVDFELRKEYLADVQRNADKDQSKLIEELVKHKETGQIKLFLISKLLKLRSSYSGIFMNGSYTPLQVEGKYKENIIAFARHYMNDYIVTVAPRYLTRIVKKDYNPVGAVWKDTRVNLPKNGEWKDCITQNSYNRKSFYMKEAFKNFPGAVLTNVRLMK